MAQTVSGAQFPHWRRWRRWQWRYQNARWTGDPIGGAVSKAGGISYPI
uniref:Alternative protein KIAA0913 n=1 Tax=Homo sapiens TaxID=9606 RepID=L8E9R3_HUMAN|nr:alternative protein KIAA0913 [Homo sapiens]